MKTLYNKEYDRLEIYFDKNKKVDSEYWQGIWEEDLVLSKLNYKKNTYVSKITKKYLPSNSKVHEAGCGLGQFVYSLKKNNYDSYGIDYANKTVKLIIVDVIKNRVVISKNFTSAPLKLHELYYL